MKPSKHPHDGPRSWPAVRRIRLVAIACAICGLATLVIMGVLATLQADKAASHPRWVKYYIVQPPSAGVRQYLYEIAAQTLGSGKLAAEIFSLNKGRPQPGGARLVNPTIIRPGWILMLPPSAHGPGVHYGPLPAVTAARSPQATPSGTPTPTATPTPSATPTTGAKASPSVSASKPSSQPRRMSGGQHGLAVEAGIGGSVLLFMSGSVILPALARRRRSGARRRPGLVRRARQVPPPVTGLTTGLPWPSSGRADDEPDGSWPGWLSIQDAAGTSPPALGPAGSTAPPGQQAPLSYLVALGDDTVEISLRGIGSDAGAIPCVAWTALPYDAPAGGTAFACVGAGDQGCLFLDLAASPGVIAIGGDRPAATRLAESISFQLCETAGASGSCAVVLVGDAVPEPRPGGATWVPALADLGSAGPAGAAATEIVFCALTADSDLDDLHRYARSVPHQVVPVVLADRTDAPWYLIVWPGTGAGDLTPGGLLSLTSGAERLG
jgi:hypothetical protein